jgi:uncharacterized protein
MLDDKLSIIKSLSVNWFGGEPLVGKQPLLTLSDAFIERCERASVRYSASITTNGYLLDENTCAQLRDRKVKSAQVSLDGPPEVHNRMRPLVGGRGTFWQIVENMKHAINYFGISVRINADKDNFRHTEELLRILAEEEFSGKITVYVGQLLGIDDGIVTPSSSYRGECSQVWSMPKHRKNLQS